MMNETEITALLERTANQLHVDPPPTAHLLAGLRRSRRKRTVWRLALASAAAIIAVSGANAASLALRGTHDAVPAAPSVGTSAPAPVRTDLAGAWTVTAIVTHEPNLTALPASIRGKAELAFAHGELSWSDGCNSGGGRYKQSATNGQDLTITGLYSTQAWCHDEIPLIQRLTDVRHISGSVNTRHLYASSDQVIIELQRR